MLTNVRTKRRGADEKTYRRMTIDDVNEAKKDYKEENGRRGTLIHEYS